MRDLKFRAFCEVEMAGSPSGNIMVYFSHIELDNGLWCSPDDEYIYHINEWLSKPMQFTGLKDRNGKEIYEGDIITISSYSPDAFPHEEGYHYDLTGVVRFMPSKGFYLRIYKRHDTDNDEIIENRNKIGFITQSKSIVLGNIYENPDLLK